MPTHYDITHHDTDLVTQVFVTNRQATQAARTCARALAPEAKFYYLPWQTLKPSAGARECFCGPGAYGVVARLAEPAAACQTVAPSALIPVQLGHCYLAFPGRHEWRVVALPHPKRSAPDAAVVISAPARINALRLALDWYCGAVRIGVTEPLVALRRAGFQSDGSLLFLPTEPLQSMPQRLTPADLALATRYRAPVTAPRVGVQFGPPQGVGLPQYSFTSSASADG